MYRKIKIKEQTIFNATGIKSLEVTRPSEYH